MDLVIAGRVCVITGGSRGIGLETARMLRTVAGAAWSVDAGTVQVII
jgi:NAD(P)-dependent dehydrogenase (short-subunit alcohol dehydrogenase family)